MQIDCKRDRRRGSAASLALAGVLAGCSPAPGPEPDTEVISRVVLSFAPTGGGAPIEAAFDDPDGDGGVSGAAEPIELRAGTEYTLRVRFINGLSGSAVDLTDEVEAEAEDHFVFLAITPGALATHAYADRESDYGDDAVGEDLPVGLVHTLQTGGAGSGELRVMLRHLPALNGAAQKSAELPADFAAGAPLPGEVDVDVTFELGVS